MDEAAGRWHSRLAPLRRSMRTLERGPSPHPGAALWRGVVLGRRHAAVRMR